MKERIIREIHEGNGNQFSVKEILQAHIRDGEQFKTYVRDKFESGSNKIGRNWTFIRSIGIALSFLATGFFYLAFA